MKVLLTGGSGFIGRHAVQFFAERGHDVANVDIAPPPHDAAAAWYGCNILDARGLARAFADFGPDAVVHLAAHASMEGESLDTFRANTDGTANVLEAVRSTPTVQRLVVTSTQHVRTPGSGRSEDATSYDPYMLYGQSKVITEQLTRDADLEAAWTIVRPTAVWGPHHTLLADGLWRLIHKGWYVHPANDPVIRSYGYVSNVAWQIDGLLAAERRAVDRRVFYVADANMPQVEWVNAFARELTGRDVRSAPLASIRLLSRTGDALRRAGVGFPLYEQRLQNLITSNPVAVEPTLELLGPPPVSLEQGVARTAEWLKRYYAGDGA